MVEALPSAIQRKLEQSLSQWQHWQCPTPLTMQPRIIARLSGGRSNYSVRVAAGGEHFVIRIDGVDPAQLYLNRSVEKRAQAMAAQLGLAPAPCYFNPELGVLVSRWCEPDGSKPPRQKELVTVAGLLRNIHELPALKFRLQVGERARRYIAQLGENAALKPEFIDACERLSRAAIEPVLCHNDLLAANRLWHGGRLLALDWEYAAMGDPLFDLAVICEGDALSEEEVEVLLRTYLGTGCSEQMAKQLQDNRLVYRELSRLWDALVQRSSKATHRAFSGD